MCQKVQSYRVVSYRIVSRNISDGEIQSQESVKQYLSTFFQWKAMQENVRRYSGTSTADFEYLFTIG